MASWCKFFLTICCAYAFLVSAQDADSPRFIVLSPPKCGTHLIAKILTSITEQEPAIYLGELGTPKQAVKLVAKETSAGHFVVAHNFQQKTLERLVKRGYRVIFIIRDPRDQLISVMKWLREGQWPWLQVSKIPQIDEQIHELITGARFGWRCFNGCFGRYYNVAKTVVPNRIFTTRFESLVGPHGGGSTEAQVNEILNLAAFLKVPLSNERAIAIANEAWGGTKTFRQGEKIGAWKRYFSPLHQQAYEQLYTPMLIELGYE